MNNLLDLPNELILLILRQFINDPYKEPIISLTSKELSKFFIPKTGIPITQPMAFEGRLSLLKWVKSNKKFSENVWDESTCVAAAKGNQLEVLRWLKDIGCPWNKNACLFAAKEGHVEILKFLRANGCPWTEQVFDLAAGNGHIEVLQWLKKNTPDISWDLNTSAIAAKKGRLEVLKWLRANGCPWDKMTCACAAERTP